MLQQEPPLTEAGPVNEDIYWERITYFLKRVIPAAEEHKVRLACHPHDPGMPMDKGYRGVHTVQVAGDLQPRAVGRAVIDHEVDAAGLQVLEQGPVHRGAVVAQVLFSVKLDIRASLRQKA